MEICMTQSSASRRVAYTILLGGYEELLPQPAIRSSGIDTVCFTDNPELSSEDWTVRLITPRYPGDIVRSQREIKTRVGRYLAEYGESLYLDNTVLLKRPPEEILDAWLADEDIVLNAHSFRERLIDEFDEVVRLNYDDAVRVHEQLWDYACAAPELLDERPLWTGLMARRHSAKTHSAMEIWHEQILRYSRRDQLSVGYAFRLASCRVRVLTHDNFDSPWHSWAVDPSRKVAQGKRPPLPSGPLLADLLRASGEVEALRLEINALNVRIDEGNAALATETHRAEAAERLVDAMRSSTSWRVTSPLRSLLGRFRRG